MPPPNSASDPLLGFLTVAEFRKIYGPGTTKTFQLLATGELVGRKFGARTLIERASAEAWAARLPTWRSTRPQMQAASKTGAAKAPDRKGRRREGR
jgi:hypothetical protein